MVCQMLLLINAKSNYFLCGSVVAVNKCHVNLLHIFYFTTSIRSIFSGSTFSVTQDYIRLEYPGIGYNLICLFFQGFVFYIIVAMLECKVVQNILSLCKSSETAFCKSATDKKCKFILETQSLSVKYGNNKSEAVKSVSLNLQKKDCLCLMGKNGAGKSSFFAALTGQGRRIPIGL